MKETAIFEIIKKASSGNESLFNRFIEETYRDLLPILITITGSKVDAEDIFISSVQKFWERFIVELQPPPDNGKAYLLSMCKNAWFMHKRSKQNIVTSGNIQDFKLISEPAEVDKSTEEYAVDDHEKWLKQKALSQALENLSEKCKALIESELNNIQLKDLQQQMGFPNYQAIAQAKYNCKKRLVKEVYQVLKKLKNSESFE